VNSYFSDLQFNALPIPEWGVFLAWLVLFIAANFAHLKGRALANSQAHISIGPPPGLVRPFSARLVLAQVIVAAAVFAFASFIGGAGFVFFAGGWVVVAAASLALNIRTALFLAALTKPGLAEGSLRLSNRLAVRDQAFQLLGLATLSLCIGALVAHLALLGGGLFLAATAIGYLRKAHAPRP
jgi:hypothetical protein